MSAEISTIQALYGFITKLVALLEDDLTLLTTQKKQSTIIATKNITATLNKLVNLIGQLKKLTEGEDLNKESKISENDQIIIDSFLKNYLTEQTKNK